MSYNEMLEKMKVEYNTTYPKGSVILNMASIDTRPTIMINNELAVWLDRMGYFNMYHVDTQERLLITDDLRTAMETFERLAER